MKFKGIKLPRQNLAVIFGIVNLAKNLAFSFSDVIVWGEIIKCKAKINVTIKSKEGKLICDVATFSHATKISLNFFKEM